MNGFARTLPLVLFATASCVGTDVGNPPDDRRVTGALEFAAYQDAESDEMSSSVMENRGATALVVEGGSDVQSAWLSIEAIVVTPAEDCSGGARRTIEGGPWTVDLLAGEVYPEPPILTRSPDEFCSVRLEFGPMRDGTDAAPAELLDKSIYFEGTTPSGNPLTIASATKRKLRYDGDGFVVDGDDGDEKRFITAFEADVWFDGIDVGNSMGPVDIDDTGSDIGTFLRSLSQASRIVPDADDDGEIDTEEFTNPVGRPAN